MKFKGWQMVYTGMMMEFSVVGFIFYCFPLMFNALERDLGATQSQLSGALSLWFISYAVASIFLGRLLDKFSIKKNNDDWGSNFQSWVIFHFLCSK